MTRKLILPLAALAVSLPMVADDEGNDPSRGVARISLINGDVSLKRGDSADWSAAAPNAPLVAGDHLFTGPASRTEIQFDYANLARLASNTEVRLVDLQYRRYSIQLAKGMLTYRVLRTYEGVDVEISTPSVSVRPMKKGMYRIMVRDDGTTQIAVRSGEVEIYTPTGSQRLTSGRTMLVRGDPSNPEFQPVSDLPDDDWDNWNESRDRQLERSSSYNYVSRDVYGAEDLDGHGNWVNVPPYGWVWQPYASAGWAPYRYGRWAWVDWYGWSWVSYDPWGWAPYHYGRWFYAGNRWCWWPGGIYSRHYWRPALVSFFGWGGGFSFGIGFGRVGWVPLAPYEVYRPWYGRGYYGRHGNNTRINIVNNVNIRNVYRNARVRDGYTVVDGRDFSQGRVNAIRTLNDGDLRTASLVHGQVPVTPDRASLRMADREPRRFAENTNERFFSRRSETARAERVSFDDQRRGIEQATRASFGEQTRGGRGDGGPRGDQGAARVAEDSSRRTAEGISSPRGDQDQGGRRRSGEPSRSASGEARGGNAEGGRVAEAGRDGESRDNGWRRLGDPSSRGNGSVDSRRAAEPDSGGWRRFGEPVRSSEAGAPGAERRSNRESGGRSAERQAESNGGEPRRTAEPDSGGWRRFGEPTRSSDGGAPRVERRPAGEAVVGSAAERQPDRSGAERRSEQDRGWRRFDSNADGASRSENGFGQRRAEIPADGGRISGGSRRSSGDGGRAAEPPRSEERRFGDFGAGRSRDGGESRRMSEPSRQSDQPVRVSPPIIRERTNPRSEGGRPQSFERGGGGRRGDFGGSMRMGGGGGRSSGGFSSGGGFDSGGGRRGGDFGGSMRMGGGGGRSSGGFSSGGGFGGGGGRSTGGSGSRSGGGGGGRSGGGSGGRGGGGGRR